MKGAMWWIDRWRQSRAFTDMTAEEQGLYRNLCDELWLREDHAIPDDPRILSRVSGDPEAWARSGAKVLSWMKRVPAGWTNETALEVIGQSKARAERQARYRDRTRNGARNEPRNNPDNTGHSPSPSPSQSLTTDRTTERAAVAPRVPAEQWNAEAADDFQEAYAGPPPKQFFAQVQPLARKYGWRVVRPALRTYLAETPLELLAIPKNLEVRIVRASSGLPPTRAAPSGKALARAENFRAALLGGLKGDGTI